MIAKDFTKEALDEDMWVCILKGPAEIYNKLCLIYVKDQEKTNSDLQYRLLKKRIFVLQKRHLSDKKFRIKNNEGKKNTECLFLTKFIEIFFPFYPWIQSLSHEKEKNTTRIRNA